MTTIKKLIQNAQEPHSKRGLSSCGLGAAKQIIQKDPLISERDNLPFGVFQKGKEGHRYFQEHVFPDGAIIYNLTLKSVDCGQKYDDYGDIDLPEIEIIGHEQNIYLMIGGKMRKSSMDTVILNITDNEFEIWDYKFKSYFTFKNLKGAEDENREQVNLYIHQFQKMLKGAGIDIPCRTGRLIYILDSDWVKVKVATFYYDEKVALNTIDRLELVEEVRDNPHDHGHLWSELAAKKCLYWKWCKYCDGKMFCLRRFSKEFKVQFGDHDQVRGVISTQKRNRTLDVY